MCQLRLNVFDEIAKRERLLLGVSLAAAPVPAVEVH
jgi:hypothetical protein